jgi:hypothetical protein
MHSGTFVGVNFATTWDFFHCGPYVMLTSNMLFPWGSCISVITLTIILMHSKITHMKPFIPQLDTPSVCTSKYVIGI